MNDTPVLFKYADDSTIVVPVWNDSDVSADLVNQFLSWNINNQMLCNPSECKELIFRKKDSSGTLQFTPINNIPQCDSLVLLRLTCQPNCKFSKDVRLKLAKANKCLHIVRTLRKELFSQKEIDHLFKTLVLPILTYGLAVYGIPGMNLDRKYWWSFLYPRLSRLPFTYRKFASFASFLILHIKVFCKYFRET